MILTLRFLSFFHYYYIVFFLIFHPVLTIPPQTIITTYNNRNYKKYHQTYMQLNIHLVGQKIFYGHTTKNVWLLMIVCLLLVELTFVLIDMKMKGKK